MKIDIANALIVANPIRCCMLLAHSSMSLKLIESNRFIGGMVMWHLMRTRYTAAEEREKAAESIQNYFVCIDLRCTHRL